MTHTQETRLGRRCAATEGRGKEARASFDQTFQFHGPRLYNALPRELRNLTGCGTDFFKEKLDQYLAGIADEPAFPGFIPTGITETRGPIKLSDLPSSWQKRREKKRNKEKNSRVLKTICYTNEWNFCCLFCWVVWQKYFWHNGWYRRYGPHIHDCMQNCLEYIYLYIYI